MGELAHQLQTESLKLVLLDEFVEIDAQKLESDTHVISKGERVEHVDDIHCIVFILLSKIAQYPNLLLRLSMKALLVANHFQRHVFVCFVVVGLYDLSERSLANNLEDFVPVAYVIMRYMDIRALIVIVIAIVGHPNDSWPLLGVSPYKVDLWIIKYLVMLVRRELIHVQLHHNVRSDRHGFWLAAHSASQAVAGVRLVGSSVLGYIGRSDGDQRRARLAVGARMMQARRIAVKTRVRTRYQTQTLGIARQILQTIIRARI